MEEWFERSDAAGIPREQAESDFHEFLTADLEDEPRLQFQVRDEGKRPYVGPLSGMSLARGLGVEVAGCAWSDRGPEHPIGSRPRSVRTCPLTSGFKRP
jgi:hypothetical protein